MTRTLQRTIAASLLALTVAACGGDAGDADASAESAAAAAGADQAAPASTAAPEVSAEASMTVDDIDRWQRGMQAELEAVRQAGEQFRSARSGSDSVTAMMAANETSTRAAGAKGAGVDEQRYGRIRSAMSSIVRDMAPLGTEMDVSQMPAQMRDAMKANRDSSLARTAAAFSPALIEALRPRAEALRKQELELVAARLQAAGMAPPR